LEFGAITSTDNVKIKRMASLHTPKGRKKEGLFLCEGQRVVEEAVAHLEGVELLAVDEERAQRFMPLLEQAAAAGADVFTVNRAVMRKLSGEEGSPGIICAARWQKPEFNAAHIADKRLCVLLDALQDPGNMGAVIRTADALDAPVIVGEGCCDVYSEKVVRSAAGCLFHGRIFFGKAEQAAEELAREGWDVLCGELNGEDFFRRGADKKRCAVVIGNEGAGVSPGVMAACTRGVKLPMPGGAESLNAAVAAGIMLYSIYRDQNY